MSLRDIQSALARLFTEAPLREEYARDPQAVGLKLGISDKDLPQWLAISQAQVDTFAAALIRKRLSAARKLLPQSAQILGSDFGKEFLSWAGTLPSLGIDHHQRDAIRFAEHLLNRELDPAWLVDYLRWERALLVWKLDRCRVRWTILHHDVTPPQVSPTRAPSRRRIHVFSIALLGYRRLIVRRSKGADINQQTQPS